MAKTIDNFENAIDATPEIPISFMLKYQMPISGFRPPFGIMEQFVSLDEPL